MNFQVWRTPLALFRCPQLFSIIGVIRLLLTLAVVGRKKKVLVVDTREDIHRRTIDL